MIKDKQWLKEALLELKNKGNPENNPTEKEIELGKAQGWAWNNCVDRAYELVEQLEEPEAYSQIEKLANFIMSEVEGEPSQSQGAVDTAIRIIKSYQNQEVLSQEWIDERSNGASPSQYVWVDDLQNLLVPKKVLPMVPEWFDEWWKCKRKGESILFYNIEDFYDVVYRSEIREVQEYISSPGNKQKLLNIIVNELDYVVEREQKYYARIKGWELFADFVGTKYWGVVSSYGRLGIGSVDDAISMTKDEWNELGINDKNADFVPAEENE